MKSRRSRRGGVTSFILALALGACGGKSDNGVTAPVISKPCGNSGTVQLSTLQATTIPCTAGTDVTLQGGGASYLIVPQYATGSAVNRATAYQLGIASGTSATLTAAGAPSLSVAPAISFENSGPRTTDGHARQRLFDAALRADAEQKVAHGVWKAIAPGGGIRRVAVPAQGTITRFHILSSESPVQFTAVGARLEYVGTYILLYVDTLSPPNGFSSSQLQAFGQLFDQTLYPLDLQAFGTPSDIDQNGHLIVLLSPVVNALTPKASCATEGFVGGFFTGNDLASTDTSSNQGEIFYSLAPDPNGTVSCSHTVNDLLLETPATFLHELQHLINFSQHVVAHRGSAERGWLDEGLSIVAEELGSLYYENKYPPPTGRSNPAQLFPDSSQGFINGLLFSSYQYLLKTDTATVTLHSDGDGGIAWRGGDWLLMRWLGDVKGTAIYKALVQSSLTGTANIASAAGESFDGLFGDFSLALYTDSIPGTPKASMPVRNKFVVRNLRQMYQRLYDTSQPSRDVPRPFPIIVTPLSGTVAASMVPGTMAFYRLDTTTGQSTATIRFQASPGTALPESLHPQLSIFRLP